MARKTVAQLSEEVAAIAAGQAAILELLQGEKAAPKVTRRRKAEKVATFPAVGSTFTYTSKAGNSVEHTIEAIRGRGKRRRAFTDQGNKFPVALLSNAKLIESGVVTPA
jgi:hypothetical protein